MDPSVSFVSELYPRNIYIWTMIWAKSWKLTALSESLRGGSERGGGYQHAQATV